MVTADWEPRPGDSCAFNDQELKKKRGHEKTQVVNSTNLASLHADLSQGPFREQVVRLKRIGKQFLVSLLRRAKLHTKQGRFYFICPSCNSRLRNETSFVDSEDWTLMLHSGRWDQRTRNRAPAIAVLLMIKLYIKKNRGKR